MFNQAEEGPNEIMIKCSVRAARFRDGSRCKLHIRESRRSDRNYTFSGIEPFVRRFAAFSTCFTILIAGLHGLRRERYLLYQAPDRGNFDVLKNTIRIIKSNRDDYRLRGGEFQQCLFVRGDMDHGVIYVL